MRRDPSHLVEQAMASRDVMPSPRQLALAERLSIVVEPGMTYADVRTIINGQPATEAQTHWVRMACKRLGVDVPASFTYGQAAQILHGVLPLVNDKVLLEQGWDVGSELTWNGREYRIWRVLESKRVMLEPIGETAATMTAAEIKAERCKTHNPLSLLSAYEDELPLDEPEPDVD